MLIFTGHSRKWHWQPRFEVKRRSGVKLFLLTWKHIQAHLTLGICRPAPDHLYLDNLGLIRPKQKPCVNYLWRCNDFRAAADLHLVSKWGPECRLRFRHVTLVLSSYLPAVLSFQTNNHDFRFRQNPNPLPCQTQRHTTTSLSLSRIPKQVS